MYRCCIKNFLGSIVLKSRQDILKNTNKKGFSDHSYELWRIWFDILPLKLKKLAWLAFIACMFNQAKSFNQILFSFTQWSNWIERLRKILFLNQHNFFRDLFWLKKKTSSWKVIIWFNKQLSKNQIFYRINQQNMVVQGFAMVISCFPLE